jgi:type 1 glutamine amidotransferase
VPVIDYHADIRALVAVRGHPFDRTAFASLFEDMTGISATMVDQPAAALLMNPAGMRDFDVLVLYDMPGLDFAAADRPGHVVPDPALIAGFEALLAQGKGVVALHHALAGWPAWPGFAEHLGGRFLYRPGPLRGTERLDSGYRHDVAYDATVVGDHPVTAGLPSRFPLVDELYLAEIFDDSVTPLLHAEASFTRDDFWSASHAVTGRMFCRDDWDHPSGSNLIGWTKRAINSPLVYLQPGDGPPTYANPHYRRLVENAIRWVVAEGRPQN